MNWWREIIVQARRAAFTAGAASILTLVACLDSRSPEPQAPAAYHGIWITLPAVDEGPGQIANAQVGEGPGQGHSQGETTTSLAFEQAQEGELKAGAAFPTQPALVHAVTSITRDLAQVSPEEVLASWETAIWEPPSYTDSLTVLVAAAPEPASEAPDTDRPHLDHMIPEIIAGTSADDGTSDGQRNVLKEAPRVALNSSSLGPDIADGSHADISGAASPGFSFRGSDYRASSSELALLQRWNESGEGAFTAAGDGLAFVGSGGSWVSVESEFSGETFGLSEISPAFGQAGEWEQNTSLSSDLQLSNGTRMTLGHSYSGSSSQEDENFGVAFVGLSDDWEENTLNNTALKVGLWGDRLELTSLHSLSRYGEVALADDVALGQGFFQGLDADLLSGESVSLSVSGSYGIADDAYGSSGDDDAGVPGAGTEAMDYGLEAGFALRFADLSLTHEKTWETEDIGEDYQNLVSSDYEVSLAFDSLDLMLSYNQSSETEGRGEDRERQTSVGYAAEGEYEVQALRGLLGNPFGAAFWDYAPTSISASYGIQQNKGSSGARDETTELGVAASWDWDGGYAGLGYSYSFQDDQQVGSGDNDYRSESFDIGGGLYGGRWAFDGGLYVSRSAGLGQWNEASELGVDPYVNLSYQPEHMPDLSVSGSASYYQGDYISDGGTSMSRSWEVLTELDFAKFWPEVLDSEDERMMLVFQLEGDSSLEEWGDDVSRDSSLDYFVGFKVDLTLGE